ncbi:MAG: TIGR02206 family membrane protein [Verrucomicrobiota bacterium]
MLSAAPFYILSVSHQTVLVLTLLTIVLLGVLRRWRSEWARIGEKVLGSLLLLTWPASMAGHLFGGDFSGDNALPCHFCDVAAVSGGIALWTRNRLACEMIYFFGLAGTLQGLLTPNLKADFPDLRFFAFFMTHAGVVIAAIHVVTSMGCPPRIGVVPRMVAITLGYAAIAGGVNKLAGTNYGFLCHKPEAASLMDHLGAWPWYIASLIGLCVVFYTILNLPFVIQRKIRKTV